ncbi:PulJ/GspJ family protein [Photobacterium lutimaris]|uniref:Prepilin-type N-terminal cleavage/methylation domain-containing protein n=1 Tax=Photobacterium lutimaris TaxID=388278 RepID=A0A2T3IID9_9GAMM|nr:prepilin-type N-terminal cleavage/methylation domain-containing protein [Photobacterium lutimaris]PSU28092.1 hypothetical protein C9I99_26510 [Photobacterium lutimaris]TDR70162.1 pilin/secretion family protein with methylation motif [Photobacterium lutimaris]
MNRVKQSGMTLIELMLACAMGTVLLMVLSSVFANGLSTSSRISQQLSFDSHFHELNQFIRDDLRRAGFAIEGARAGAVKWEDSPQTVFVNAAWDCLAYAYEFTDGGTDKVRYSSLYLDENSELILYTKEQNTTELPKNIANACSGGEVISVSSEIQLTSFVVDTSLFPAITIAMSAKSQVNGSEDSSQLNVTVVN